MNDDEGISTQPCEHLRLFVVPLADLYAPESGAAALQQEDAPGAALAGQAADGTLTVEAVCHTTARISTR